MSPGSKVALVLILTFSPFAKAKVANDYRVPQALSGAERARVYPIGNFKRARKFNTAGYKRFKVKDRRGALANYRRAVKASPAYEQARFNLACELSVSGQPGLAIEQLEHLFRIGTPKARKLLSRARYDSDFTALHSDPRYQAIITEFDIDQSVGIIAQLCADPGKVTTIVDDRRGFYYQRETESAKDNAKTDRFIRRMKSKKARKTLETFLKDGGQWCEGGKFRQESFNGDRNQQLIFAQQTKSDVCAYRSEGAEWTTREYICFVREARGWFVYAVSHIPDGPLAPEWDERLMRDFARAKKLGMKVYQPR